MGWGGGKGFGFGGWGKGWGKGFPWWGLGAGLAVGAAAGATAAAASQPYYPEREIVYVERSPRAQPTLTYDQLPPAYQHSPRTAPVYQTPPMNQTDPYNQPVTFVQARPVARIRNNPSHAWKGHGKGREQQYAPPPPPLPKEPPLGINVVAVFMPAEATETVGDVLYYGVDVLPETDGDTWRVWRRHNDFEDLKGLLGNLADRFSDAPFPRKEWSYSVDQRRKQLEAWLQCVIQHPNSRSGEWRAVVTDFLEAYAAPPQNSAMPQATAAQQAFALPPSAPPQPASGGMGAGRSNSGQMMGVVIPEGVVGGQPICIVTPDGRPTQVEVPSDKCGGDRLELWYDARNGVLTPLR